MFTHRSDPKPGQSFLMDIYHGYMPFNVIIPLVVDISEEIFSAL